MALRTVEILAMFAAIGLPLNLVLRPRSGSGLDARLLLAPVSGLALTAVYAFMFLGLGQPVGRGVIPFWVALGVAWLVVAVRSWSSLRLWLKAPRKLSGAGVVLAGCVVVLAFYLMPFLRDPSLVFWHYSGTDAYFYMRVAERDIAYSRWDLPPVSPFDGANGFLTQDLRLFADPHGYGSKPGTFALLALVSALLRALPHEAFSPLMAALAATLFLALVWLGSRFGLSKWFATGFGLAGSLAMVVWFFGDNTFLGNMLALPLAVGVLGLIDSELSLRIGLYGGLLLGTIMVVFPDGPMAVAGFALPAIVLALFGAYRAQRLRRVSVGLVAWLATTALAMAPMFGYFLRSSNLLDFVNAPAAGGVSGASPDRGLGHVLEHTNWLWPALNLNVLPPYDLASYERPFVALLAVLYLGCLAIAVSRHQIKMLLFGLEFAAILLAGTFSGFVSDDYMVFRVLALFWWAPLLLLINGLEVAGRGFSRWAACWVIAPGVLFSGLSIAEHSVVRLLLVSLTLVGLGLWGWQIARMPDVGQRAGQTLAVVGVIVLLGRFGRDDYRQFSLGWQERFRDPQYSQADLDDRRAITSLVGQRTVTLASQIPSFIGLSNVLMLFSSLHLGAPDYFYQFLFFPPDDPPKHVVYSADLVLWTFKYTDVYNVSPSQRALYNSGGYELLENDLVPFFDNGTLPVINPFPLDYVRARQLTVSREFARASDIEFFSRQDRDVRFTFRFAADSSPFELRFRLDDQPEAMVPVAAGDAALPPRHVAPGLHTLALAAPAQPAELDAVTLN